MRKYRSELAEFYKKEEEDALARGDYDEVIVEEFNCAMCKKTFKKEGQLNNHLQSKLHKKVAAQLKEEIGLDPETESKIEE